MSEPEAERALSPEHADQLIRRLRADTTLLAQASDAARSHVLPAKALPQVEVQRHIEVILDVMQAVVSGDGARIDRAMVAADDVAGDRAEQGIPLPILLDGVQSARAVMLARLLEQGAATLGTDLLLRLLPPIDAAVMATQNRMVLAHRAAEQNLRRDTRAIQVEALRALLDGGPLTWAAEAGLDPDARYHCLIADVSVPRDSRRLAPLIEGTDGISGLVYGLLCGVTTRLAEQPAELESLVVCSPAVPVADLATTYRLCREALAALQQEGATGMHPLVGSAAGLALASQPELGTLLARTLLDRLDPADEFHQELARTARAHLAVRGHIDTTATGLHVHPNTVKYRLRRFAEVTGAGPGIFTGQLIEAITWWWALDRWLASAGPGDAGPR